jgi:hypothetical protein
VRVGVGARFPYLVINATYDYRLGAFGGSASATCVLFMGADYGPVAEESDDGERPPPAPVRAYQTARPEPTADPPTALGR